MLVQQQDPPSNDFCLPFSHGGRNHPNVGLWKCMMCINFFNLAFLFTLGAGKIRVNRRSVCSRFSRFPGGCGKYALCSSETFTMAYHGREWKRAKFLANTRASYQCGSNNGCAEVKTTCNYSSLFFLEQFSAVISEHYILLCGQVSSSPSDLIYRKSPKLLKQTAQKMPKSRIQSH